jgi:hypothetical protein
MKKRASAPAAGPVGYEAFLRVVKERIASAQLRAAIAVNSELVQLYWAVGRDILAKQEPKAGVQG